MDPVLEFAFGEILRKFDELEARSARRWAALERRSAAMEPRPGAFKSSVTTELVVADSWGGLFDETPEPVAALDWASSESASEAESSEAESRAVREQRAEKLCVGALKQIDDEVVADNWGGLFEPATAWEQQGASDESCTGIPEEFGATLPVVPDNWGGMFEQLGFTPKEHGLDLTAHIVSTGLATSIQTCTLELDAESVRLRDFGLSSIESALPVKLEIPYVDLVVPPTLVREEQHDDGSEDPVEDKAAVFPEGVPTSICLRNTTELKYIPAENAFPRLTTEEGNLTNQRVKVERDGRAPLLQRRLRRPWRVAPRLRPWRARPRPPWSLRPWGTPSHRRLRRFPLRQLQLRRPRQGPVRRRGRPPRLLIRVRGRRPRLRARSRAPQRRAALQQACVAELSATAHAEEQRHHIHPYKAMTGKQKSSLWTWVAEAERVTQPDRAAFAGLGIVDPSLRLRVIFAGILSTKLRGGTTSTACLDARGTTVCWADLILSAQFLGAHRSTTPTPTPTRCSTLILYQTASALVSVAFIPISAEMPKGGMKILMPWSLYLPEEERLILEILSLLAVRPVPMKSGSKDCTMSRTFVLVPPILLVCSRMFHQSCTISWIHNIMLSSCHASVTIPVPGSNKSDGESKNFGFDQWLIPWPSLKCSPGVGGGVQRLIGWLQQKTDENLVRCDAVMRPLPWPSFNMFERTSVTCHFGQLWKPPWYVPEQSMQKHVPNLWLSLPSGALFSVECNCSVNGGSLQHVLQLLLVVRKNQRINYLSGGHTSDMFMFLLLSWLTSVWACSSVFLWYHLQLSVYVDGSIDFDGVHITNAYKVLKLQHKFSPQGVLVKLETLWVPSAWRRVRRVVWNSDSAYCQMNEIIARGHALIKIVARKCTGADWVSFQKLLVHSQQENALLFADRLFREAYIENFHTPRDPDNSMYQHQIGNGPRHKDANMSYTQVWCDAGLLFSMRDLQAPWDPGGTQMSPLAWGQAKAQGGGSLRYHFILHYGIMLMALGADQRTLELARPLARKASWWSFKRTEWLSQTDEQSELSKDAVIVILLHKIAREHKLVPHATGRFVVLLQNRRLGRLMPALQHNHPRSVQRLPRSVQRLEGKPHFKEGGMSGAVCQGLTCGPKPSSCGAHAQLSRRMPQQPADGYKRSNSWRPSLHQPKYQKSTLSLLYLYRSYCSSSPSSSSFPFTSGF